MNKKANDLLIPFIGFTLVVILFIFFILNSFTSEVKPECIFPVELDCIGYSTQNTTQDSIVIKLQNNLYENINLTKAEVIDAKCSYSFSPFTNGSTYWPDGEIMEIAFHCKNVTPQRFVQINVQIHTETDDKELRYTGQIRYA